MSNKEKYQLSILIPVYNHVCKGLVENLHLQAETEGLLYEIIVADDGSTDIAVKEKNSRISTIKNCRYISRDVNVGRAAIRNFLAEQSRFKNLLFLDCDIELPDSHFLKRYIDADIKAVLYGGVCTEGTHSLGKHNIRYIYEHSSEPHHTALERSKQPYKSFRTTNFIISRNIMLAHPFDERFKHYGYEDVFFGKELKHNNITIMHIDNPVSIRDFEPNDVFISKTEEALRTLYCFRNELADYSKMLESIRRMEKFIPMEFFRMWHRVFGKLGLKNLKGNSPRLTIFNMYRLGYYLSLKDVK